MNTEQSLPTPRRILVVEDLEDSRESLQELLETALQVPVDAAEDGVQGLEMLCARPYALVITDLRMPKATGMWLLREVKERNLACAVVVVTGHGGVREAVEAMRLGAYDFLSKPIDPRQLVLLVDRILRERAGGDPEADAEEDRDGTEDTVRLLEPAPNPAQPASGS